MTYLLPIGLALLVVVFFAKRLRRTPDSQDEEALERILNVFIQVQEQTGFQLVEQQLLQAGNNIFEGSGGEWLTIEEEAPIGNGFGHAELHSAVLAASIPGSDEPIPFTAIRLLCPESIRDVLRAGENVPEEERSEEYANAVGEYGVSNLVASAEFISYLAKTSLMLEQLFEPKEYLFVPSMTRLGLSPDYDYNVIIFYISGAYLQVAERDLADTGSA